MDTKSLDAANAYSAALKQIQSASGAAPVKEPMGAAEGGSAFADLVTDAISDTAKASANMEATSAKAIAGQADVVDVVTAVSNAELMVSTVVNVRDKVISAYQEVLKMPI